MTKLEIKTSLKVEKTVNKYPDFVRYKMRSLRKLIIETAEETAGISHLEETLKWGQPSFVTACGSTVRMDWKERTPHQYAIYFQCTSRLVDTFRLVFSHRFRYEGKRAIVFSLNEKIPVEELKACIKAALTYHNVKHLAMLGM